MGAGMMIPVSYLYIRVAADVLVGEPGQADARHDVMIRLSSPRTAALTAG